MSKSLQNPSDFTFEVPCNHHLHEQETVRACPECIVDNWLLISRLSGAIRRYAEETDYCIACDEHPSHGHAEGCPLDDGE